jgi:uncharacterized protein (DUF2236 family)
MIIADLTEATRCRFRALSRESSVQVAADAESFRNHIKHVLGGAELRATPEGRRLVADVLRPPLPLSLRAPTAAIRQITLALLPERVRSMFGLRAGRRARAALAVASRTSRVALPAMPSSLRHFSAARRSPVRGR